MLLFGHAAARAQAPAPAGASGRTYAPLSFNESIQDLKKDMQFVPTCTIFRGLGGLKSAGWPDGDSCHSQGISVSWKDATTERVATSCQGDKFGLIEEYETPLTNYASGGGATWTVLKARSGPGNGDDTLLKGDYTHTAVGQGIEYTSGGATSVLYPAVTSNKKSVPANVALHDAADGSVVCGFTHQSRFSDDLHLGAAALTSVNNQLYLLACSWDCSRFFVYQLDPTQANCGVVVQKGKIPAALQVAVNMGDSKLRSNAGAGDDKWGTYNALAAFLVTGANNTRQMIMLGSHDGWLDTWQLNNLGSAGATPQFAKLAKKEWGTNQGGHGTKGMFLEGMTVDALQTPGGKQLRVWTFPHDYGKEGNRIQAFGAYLCPMPVGINK